jgi:predicted Zn-dependent protease
MDATPPSKNAFLATAFLQVRSGHPDEAADTLDRLEKLDPKPNAMALALRAVLARRRGELPQAAQFEQQARHLDADAAAWALEHATNAGP